MTIEELRESEHALRERDVRYCRGRMDHWVSEQRRCRGSEREFCIQQAAFWTQEFRAAYNRLQDLLAVK